MCSLFLHLSAFIGKASLKSSTFFYVGLVGSDILTLTINTVGAALLADGDLPLTQGQCDVYEIVSTTLFSMTVLIHCSLCFDRIARIIRPFDYMAWKTGLRAKCIVILVVAVCFLLLLSPSLVSGFVFSMDLRLFSFEPDVTDSLYHETDNNKYFLLILLAG